MKSFIFLLLGISLHSLTLSGQTISDIKFEYDAAGNRTKREIISYEGGAKSAEVIPEEEEFDFEQGLNVYPNPASHSIYVTLNQEVLECDRQELFLFDNLGRQLYHSQNLSELNQIDVSELPYGTYILKLIYNQKHKEWIIVKQ